MIAIRLPFPAPPLKSNKRLHHMAEHRMKKDIRMAGLVLGTRARQDGHGPVVGPVQVRMVWSVPTRHVRDADAGQPTLKSFQDGLVDAGLLPSDGFQVVVRSFCEIEYAPGKPMALRVEITPA